MTLQVVFRASYKGPSGQTYRYSDKSQYDPERNVFLNLGPAAWERPHREHRPKAISPERE